MKLAPRGHAVIKWLSRLLTAALLITIAGEFVHSLRYCTIAGVDRNLWIDDDHFYWLRAWVGSRDGVIFFQVEREYLDLTQPLIVPATGQWLQRKEIVRIAHPSSSCRWIISSYRSETLPPFNFPWRSAGFQFGQSGKTGPPGWRRAWYIQVPTALPLTVLAFATVCWVRGHCQSQVPSAANVSEMRLRSLRHT